MDRTKWRELLSEYIEGTLSPEMAEKMKKFAAQNPECQEDEAIMRSLYRELKALPEVEPPLFLRDNIIARVERESANGLVGAGWRNWFPNMGRFAIGSALAGGVAVALGMMVLFPRASDTPEPTQTAALAGSVLPGPRPNMSDAPALRIARMTTVVPGGEPVYDFSFQLKNARQGTARFRLLGDTRDYRFTLNDGKQEMLRVPFSAVGNRPTVELGVQWSAGDGVTHTRYLFVPVAKDDAVPQERQSFGLPEMSVIETVREISARYRQPITLDEVPGTLMVRLTARDETAEETLRRTLKEAGLKVVATSDGLLIERDPAALPATP